VDRPTNCFNDRQGMRRFKDIHRPKRNPKRGHIKKHTECFSCSRIYFDRLWPSCSQLRPQPNQVAANTRALR
jgi:hypothetical protein